MTTKSIVSPTIRDVARLADVSVATVSRFLNQKAVLSSETAQRVQEAMRELNYTPHAVARSLATHRTHTIGLLLTDIQGDFFTPLLKGIESETRARGYSLLISTTTGSEPLALLPMGPHNADGVLIFLDSLYTDALRSLAQKQFPVVLIHQTPPDGLKIPCVTIENKSSLLKVIDHLVMIHGRRQIAFLRGPEGNEDSYWREMGYREGLANHRLRFDPDLVGLGGFDRGTAYLAVKGLLAAHPEIDAMFTGDDEAAIGALLALRDSGRRVPEEIAVIGFDDQLMAPYLMPPLTTVHAPTEELGRAAAHQLLCLIEKGEAEPLTLLPTQLVIRRSCGCDFYSQIKGGEKSSNAVGPGPRGTIK
jgi:DNA-binding LacI/PurR family transcriptional regulator